MILVDMRFEAGRAINGLMIVMLRLFWCACNFPLILLWARSRTYICVHILFSGYQTSGTSPDQQPALCIPYRRKRGNVSVTGSSVADHHLSKAESDRHVEEACVIGYPAAGATYSL
jgi:hypothetical protein